MGMVRTALVAASAVTAAVAIGATGMALADETPNPIESGPTADATERPGPQLRDGRHDRRGMPGRGLVGGALHGEVVVPDPEAENEFRTLVIQRGEATAVDGDEITVESEDGFTATYAVTDDTVVAAARDGIEAIEEGAEVSVVAVEEGDGATALRVTDRTVREGMRERFGLDGPGRRA